MRLINQVRLGGFTSGKHGILHIHLGNLKSRIDVLHSIVDQYPTLISYISPTHCSRTRALFDTCVDFAKKGGMMDISTGGTRFAEAHVAVGLALEAGAPLANLTFSSDGHGGVRRENPVTGEITYTPAPLTLNFKEMVALVQGGILPLEDALRLITSNPAKNLSLKQKGRIAVGCDADFVALNEDLSIHSVYAKGKTVYEA
jgi:beta-aspartyl-dipeptidase (metallo-type)